MGSKTNAHAAIDTPVGTTISDFDRDSLHSLPLSIVPLKTPALTRARMIKNVRLESAVELFDDATAGSGQIDIEGLPAEFAWPEGFNHPDLAILRKLALLPSFDVFSLRVSLRDLGIAVNDYSALRLSKRKNEELTEYMTGFTRPLIREIYGANKISCDSFEQLIGLFRDPDVKKAYQKLKIMAGRLQITIEKVPSFLEDYGDIFLSLSYYRHAMDAVRPIVADFLDTVNILRNHWQLRKDSNLMRSCKLIEDMMDRSIANTNDRFAAFDRSTRDLWGNISAEKFRAVQRLIASCHITIGGALCVLTVKMNAWSSAFPSREAGGPVRRAEFIINEIRPGIDKLQRIEDAAPALSEAL